MIISRISNITTLIFDTNDLILIYYRRIKITSTKDKIDQSIAIYISIISAIKCADTCIVIKISDFRSNKRIT